MRYPPALPVCCIAALGLTSLPALAECPTGPDDLARGIQVAHDDDSITTYRRLPSGLIEEVVNYQDESGDETVVISHLGLWVLSNHLRQDGTDQMDTMDRTTIDGGVEALPEPKQELLWTGDSVFTQAGEPPIPQQLTVSIGRERNVRYGDCTMTAWPVTIRYLEASVDILESVDYLPDFGFSVLTGIKDEVGTDIYRPLSIAVLPAAD